MTVGAILHNIETKWLYDFLTPGKCRNFSQGGSRIATSRNRHSARRIRALEQAIGVELFNRRGNAAAIPQNKGKSSIRRSAICCNS